MRFELQPSFLLTKKKAREVSALLSEAFPSYPEGKTYYRSMPCFHLLCYQNGALIGHAAVRPRQIFVGEESLRIFGISDLCVSKESQKKGVGKALIGELERKGRKGAIDFIALITDEKKFYKKQGFKKVDARAKWVLIGNQGMLGMQERTLKDSLFVKALNDSTWPKGTIDFMGPLF